MSNNNKMKGLLKGLRYISQIFDNEKEQEMQIGYPTDVKHVAHIGWDGPSVNSPSWMNEYSSPSAYQSAPLNLTSAAPNSPKRAYGDSERRNGRTPNSTPVRELPELPRASRRSSKGVGDAINATESPTRGKPERARHRRSSKARGSQDKSATNSPRQSRRSMDSSSLGVGGNVSPSPNLPEIPKKSRRKKSKESNTSGGSSRSRTKAPPSPAADDQFTSPFSDPGPGSEKDSGTGYPKSPIFGRTVTRSRT